MAPSPGILKRLTGQKLQLLVENGDRLLFASDRPAFRALWTVAFERPQLLDGADVALPAVGLAAAYLLIYGKVGRVFTHAMTREARAALRELGIEHSAKSLCRKLPPDLVESAEGYEALAREAVTPLAFVEQLRRRAP